MRTLNKVILIHCANIPYAEIELDSNCHFGGTQGVGKSTILRTLLFFYNADTKKLGIKREQTRFVDWYLKNDNSYIIYEVATERGSFCVVLFRAQSKVQFRFFDSRFEKRFFMTENGEVFNHWNQIRGVLDKEGIGLSKVIDNYTTYRDIIYGAQQNQREFKKYNLLETKQYGTIYKTIQSVYLNADVSADDIQKIIIDSLDSEEKYIDLNTYSHHLSDFEEQLNDIDEYKKEKNVKTLEQSFEVLLELDDMDSQLYSLYNQLYSREKWLNNQLPALKDNADLLSQDEVKLSDKIDHEKSLHSKRKETITSKISVLRDNLKKAREKKKYYQSQNIHEVERRVKERPSIEIKLKNLESEESSLTSQYQDIEVKYKSLQAQKEAEQSVFIQQKEALKGELKDKLIEQERGLNQEYEQLFDQLDEINTDKRIGLQEHFSIIQNNNSEKQIEINECRNKQFYQSEIEGVKTLLQKGIAETTALEQEVQKSEQEIEGHRKSWKHELEIYQKEIENGRANLNQRFEKLTQTKKGLEGKIQKYNHTLLAWLTNNKKDWSDNIGKVIDQDLLFHDELNPQLLDKLATSFYGMGIDLKSIEGRSFSLSLLEEQLKGTLSEIEKVRKESSELDQGLIKKEQSLKKKYQPQINKLKSFVEVSKNTIKKNKKEKEHQEVLIEEWLDKGQKEKDLQLSQLNTALNSIQLQLEDLKQQLSSFEAGVKQQKEVKRKEKTRRLNQYKKEFQEKENSIRSVIENYKQEIQKAIEVLIEQKNEELSGKGVDKQHLEKLSLQIKNYKAELDYIQQHQKLVFEYDKDKRELIDKQKTFENEVLHEEEKLNNLVAEFTIALNVLEEKHKEVKQQLFKINQSIQTYATELKVYAEQKGDDKLIALEEYATTVTSLEGDLTFDELHRKVYQTFDALEEKKNTLYTKLKNYLGKFSINSVLKFPSVEELENKGVREIGERLKEFVREDKISEIEKIFNERFANIINIFGTETQDLLKKTAEIDQVIKKINKDFKLKNFVSAVTNIELKLEESRNSIISVLKRIKEFQEENNSSLGVANLFTLNKDLNKINRNAVKLLKYLKDEIGKSKTGKLLLSDTIHILFKIEENGNDTGWIEKLRNVGSEGTDILVKAMLNIMLLNVFKKGASRKFDDFKLHIIMDEIGKLHSTNVQGLLRFANERNIIVLNGSPETNNQLDYGHIYHLEKGNGHKTMVKQIISKV
ncbi:ATP-binding protein [Flammeovirga pacifica]|uniref:ATP-binding protein n=2 Tax=Flammeovirga TaxID=59739 RepID=A0A1S1Z0C2_FLAPC|nr:ATP-binding protein [Flammeovirga pacifica]OHX66710.1 hypothetical protein NH26_10255 [Flammeovirga pacifica]